MKKQLPARSRTGSTLLESVAGLAVTLVVGTLVAQATAFATRQMRADSLRQLATQEAANLLEQLAGTSHAARIDPTTPQWTLSDEAARQLPDGGLCITVVDKDGLEAATRITVEVNWRSPWGDRREQVRLVSWQFDHNEESSP